MSYTNAGDYTPTLIVKNANDYTQQVTCSGETIIVTEAPKYCGDGIVQTPNGS
jgi:hypothetical protein